MIKSHKIIEIPKLLQKKYGKRNTCVDFVNVTKYFYDGDSWYSKYLLFILILFLHNFISNWAFRKKKIVITTHFLVYFKFAYNLKITIIHTRVWVVVNYYCSHSKILFNSNTMYLVPAHKYNVHVSIFKSSINTNHVV